MIFIAFIMCIAMLITAQVLYEDRYACKIAKQKKLFVIFG